MRSWPGLGRVRELPELPAILAILIAWLTLIVVESASLTGRHDALDPLHSGHWSASWSTLSFAAARVPGWTLMSVAMMVPLTVPAARHVALNSLRWRRHRAVATFLASFVAVWVVFGLIVLSALTVWKIVAHDPATDLLLPVTLVTGAAWQVTAWKARALRSCQRIVPLPPRGWRATAGCLRFGVVAAARCVGSCWPLMLVMAAVADSHLVWMAFLGAIPLAERYVVAFRRAPWLVSLVFAALAAAVAGGTPGGVLDNGFRCPIPGG